MLLKIFEDKNLLEDRIEIYCQTRGPIVEEITRLINDYEPNITGIYNEERQLLEIRDIYYFEAVDKKCFAYLQKKVFEVKYTLSQIEEALNQYGFVRINKSNIVSIYKIERIKCSANMRVLAFLSNGEQLIISRHYKKSFEAYLKSKRGLE